MKKSFIWLSMAMLVLIIPVMVFAGEKDFDVNKELVVVAEDQVIDRDYFATGERVEISGTVEGDVYVAGGEVVIDGVVEGDVLAAGGTIRVSGVVEQDVRVAGGEITISGKVGRNVTAAGGDIEITEDAAVAGSVVIGGGNVLIAGDVGSHAVIGAGAATVSSEINGDLDASAEQLRITSKAKISGDVTYWSDAEALIDEGATIEGEVAQKLPKSYNVPADQWSNALHGMRAFARVMSILSAILIGLLLVKFFPHYMDRTAENIEHKTWPALGMGIIMLIVTPIVGVILLFTLIGLPLGFIILVSYMIAVYLAKVYFMLMFGKLALRPFTKKKSPYLAVIVGAVLYGIIMLIPVLNVLFGLFALLAGLGALAISEYQLYKVALKKDIV